MEGHVLKDKKKTSVWWQIGSKTMSQKMKKKKAKKKMEGLLKKGLA